MVLHVRHHLGELLDVVRLQIDDLVCDVVVLKTPEVDAQVIRGEEIFSVWAHAQRVNVIAVAIFELFSFLAFVAGAEHLRLWKHDLAIVDAAVTVLPLHPIFEFPELDNPIVGRKQLQVAGLGGLQEFQTVDLFVELETLKVIKLRLVRLDLAEVPVIEVARVPKVRVSEDYHATASIANSQILASPVKTERGEDVRDGDAGGVALAEPIDVHPAGCVVCSRCLRSGVRLSVLLSLF